MSSCAENFGPVFALAFDFKKDVALAPFWFGQAVSSSRMLLCRLQAKAKETSALSFLVNASTTLSSPETKRYLRRKKRLAWLRTASLVFWSRRFLSWRRYGSYY
ncbi:hypothetical protein AK812_SmicGene35395 [Symbiodinium microadriaticum]|uniref:Uncharacterized protein n=1 Tax=Symbiodinium microadriaticum TaxID=2951 RepID=A0A1Q9CLL9_SYMMI|nr:hypothetical protein AK812_SmicGene35395 [Symbiodinium microadriaticum]